MSNATLPANARNAGSYLYVKVVSNMSVNFACIHVKDAIKCEECKPFLECVCGGGGGAA